MITPGVYKKVNTAPAAFLNINNRLRCWNWGKGWSEYDNPDRIGWFFEEKHKKSIDYKIAPWTLGTWSD